MVQEIPGCRIVCVLFLAKALDFCRLKHLVESVVVGILAAIVVVHLEHARERPVSIKNLIATHEGKPLRERFKDLKPAVESLLRGLLAQKSLLIERLNLICYDRVEEN